MSELLLLGGMGLLGHRMLKGITASEQYDAKVDKLYEGTRTTRGLEEASKVAGDAIPYGGATKTWFPDYQYVDGKKYKQYEYNPPTQRKEVRSFTGRGNIRLGQSSGEFMVDSTPGLNRRVEYKYRKASRPPYFVEVTY